MILNIMMITILISKGSRLTMAVLLLVTLSACTTGRQDSDGPTVIATTSIWGDVVSNITGWEVEVLVPREVDAHEYQASPAQIARLAEADLVVANGLGLEEGMTDVLESVAADGTQVLYLADMLDPIEFEADHGREGDDHAEEAEGGDEDHGHGSLDPHIWFDPIRVARATGLIAQALNAIDEGGNYKASADEYASVMEAVDDEIKSTLSVVVRRDLVTNHESMGYFADRYGFEIVGVVIPGGSTLGDPSSAQLAALVATVEEHHVAAIFAETTQPTLLAETVANEVGSDVAVVELHTESLAASGPASTLEGMLLDNARLIASVLGS